MALLLMLAYSAPVHAQGDEPVTAEEPIPEPAPDYVAACDALPVLCQELLQAWEDMKNAPPRIGAPAINYEALLPSGDALAKYPRHLQVSIKAAKRWKSLQWFADSCLDGTLPMNFEYHRYEVPGKAMLWGGGPGGEFLFPDWTWTPHGGGGSDGMNGLWSDDEFSLTCGYLEAWGDSDGDGVIDTPVDIEVRYTCYTDSTEPHYLYGNCNYKGETERASFTVGTGFTLMFWHNDHAQAMPMGLYASEIRCSDPEFECLYVYGRGVKLGLPYASDVYRQIRGE